MKSFKEYLNEQKQLDEANEITLYSVIKTDKVFKNAKDYMDKEGWNINKITLSKLLIDADPEKGKNLVRKYLNEQLNEAAKFKRIANKRGGGSYEKYRSPESKNATAEDSMALVRRLKSKLKLTDIKPVERSFMGTARAPSNTLTAENISAAVADLGATNIKYNDGINGVVRFANVYFELDGVVYALKSRQFEDGGNVLDFGEYSIWS